MPSTRSDPRQGSQHSQHGSSSAHPQSSSHSPASRQSSRSSSKKGSRRNPRERARPQRQRTYRSRAASWLEPRLLLIATATTMLGFVLQIIAISTDSWLILDAPDGIFRNASGKYLVEAYTGLWRLCRVEIEKKMGPNGKWIEEKHESCEPHNLFPSEDEIQSNKDFDSHYLDFDVKDLIQMDYTRTAIAFTIIALMVMAIGHGFAFYALRRPRYIIKRLAALLHFMAAACLLVLNEVFVKTVEHEKENMPGRIPLQAETHYGYSFILSWLVFCFFVLAGLVLLFTSHKKKAEYADSSEALEDEPMEIFRR
ncbi:uncharacterized protein LOC106011290 [Aplysia californica]|uniref:Uncharacterized protein LOC106011290 n=1 Tax=Aplysia californica TaxID=6500 RepID=A0ABM0ZWC3_APLCA|nr:uncharacterized protein LOC106011290 [Aplysia californica]